MNATQGAVTLLTTDEREASALTACLSAMGWECLVAHDCAELAAFLNASDVRGVFLSLATVTRMNDSRDREFLFSLDPVFPVARVRVSQDGHVIVASAYTGFAQALDTFIGVCASWPRRRLRSAPRIRGFVPVDLHAAPDDGADACATQHERTFAMDISEDGVFLHADQPWTVGSRVDIQCHVLGGVVNLAGRVVRQAEWGAPGRPPGVGVRFDETCRPAVRAVMSDIRRFFSF